MLPFLHDIAITEAVYSGKGAWVTYENHRTPITAVIIALCAEDFVDYVSNVQAQHGGTVQTQHDGKGGLRMPVECPLYQSYMLRTKFITTPRY